MLDCPQWSRERLSSGLEAHRSLQPAMLDKPCSNFTVCGTVIYSVSAQAVVPGGPAAPQWTREWDAAAGARLRLVAHCHWHVGEAPPTRSRLLACSMILGLH